MSNALRKFDKPADPPTQVKAVMRTRCGCEQVIDIPYPPPGMLTVELAPMPQRTPNADLTPAPYDPEGELDTRAFYLVAQGKLKDGGKTVYLYMEGPNVKKQIVVPKLVIP